MRKQYFCVFLSAILAGIMISVGGMVYLNLAAYGHKIAGAVLFAVGLFTIIIFKLHLYTGKVGYLPVSKEKGKIVSILLTILGNLVGTFAMGLTFSLQLISGTNVLDMVIIKTSVPLWEAFLLAIPCGILMFVAVEGYKKAESDIAKGLIVVFSVAVFILAGFEHSVADMFYIGAALQFNTTSALFLLAVLIGNAVGGMGFSVLTHYINKNLGGK